MFETFENFKPKRLESRKELMNKKISKMNASKEFIMQLKLSEGPLFTFLNVSQQRSLRHNLALAYINTLLMWKVKFNEEEMSMIKKEKFNEFFNVLNDDRINISDDTYLFKFRKENEIRYVFFDYMFEEIVLFKKDSNLFDILEGLKFYLK